MTDDLISRQAAIDAMTNTLWHYPNECYRNLNEYEFAKGLAELGLKSVPSEQRWIPCSKELPKRTGLYYVTIRDEDGTEYTSCMCYYINLAQWEVDVNVIAWMPEPEPYKEGE